MLSHFAKPSEATSREPPCRTPTRHGHHFCRMSDSLHRNRTPLLARPNIAAHLRLVRESRYRTLDRRHEPRVAPHRSTTRQHDSDRYQLIAFQVERMGRHDLFDPELGVPRQRPQVSINNGALLSNRKPAVLQLGEPSNDASAPHDAHAESGLDGAVFCERPVSRRGLRLSAPCTLDRGVLGMRRRSLGDPRSPADHRAPSSGEPVAHFPCPIAPGATPPSRPARPAVR
jgi:hypothetical protein